MDGDRLGPYILEERVARGGMAEVWRARRADTPGAGVVCIKRLDPSLRNDVDFIEMFRDEAALVLDLDHENIVKMQELIDGDDELAQVMEYVDGPSLARIRAAIEADGGFSVGESLQIGIYLSRALHHAHTRTRDGVVGGAPLSIVHRDVSPQNILVDKLGRVKLVDFGIAKASQRLTRTQAGTLKGKLSYMAPEQARGGPLDHRADQFAAGILVWEMLTGRRLFGGRNELLILEQVQKSDPVPPSTVKRGIPRSVDKAVLRALRWHAEERFPDMLAFERALQSCLLEVEPRGQVDLAPVVARALAQEPMEKTAAKAVAGAVRTRVISAESTGANNSAPGTTEPEEHAPTPFVTNPVAQPEHAGDFFQRRRAFSLSFSTLAAGGAGVLVVASAVGVAVWLAERDPAGPKPAQATPLFVDVASARASVDKLDVALGACKDPCAAPLAKIDAARVDAVVATEIDQCLARCGVAGAGRYQPPGVDVLEQRLDQAPAHPCRTELLDDLLDKSPLSLLGRAALADAVEQCLATATEAPKLRASLKPGALDEPKQAPPKTKQQKKHPEVALRAHIGELEHRGQIALAVGEYESAKELYASALALDPSHVDDHALLAQAFRGMGDPAGAAYHLRLWLHAHPESPDGERAVRYLRRYNQSPELKPAVTPSPEEREARVFRLLHDADAAADPLQPLERARDLSPADGRVLLRLGEAYAKAGKNDDAKKALHAALASSSGAQARAIKERLAHLGS